MRENKKKIIFAAIFISISFAIFSFKEMSVRRLFNPNKYRAEAVEKEVYWKVDSFLMDFCQKNHMELIEVGNFTHPLEKSILFGFWLRSYDSDDLESARSSALLLIQSIKQLLQDDENVKTLLKRMKSNGSIIDFFGIKIAYWDEDVNRPKAPYIAQVDFYNNTFHYYEAEPETQALCFVHKESYEDALRSL